MFSLLILALCASLGLSKNVVREKRSTKCYQELGCFSTGGLFFSLHRPINFLPQSRQKVNTQFLLYTRNNPTTYQSLKVQSQKNFVESHFSSLRPTKIISHGFLQNGFVDWMKENSTFFRYRYTLANPERRKLNCTRDCGRPAGPYLYSSIANSYKKLYDELLGIDS